LASLTASSSSSGDNCFQTGTTTAKPVLSLPSPLPFPLQLSCNSCCRKDRIIHRQRQEILVLRQQLRELAITVTCTDETPPISKQQ
jgi:hypothetical protein